MFCVPKHRLLQSSTFRLALVYMLLFSLSVLLLLGFIYWSTAGYMVRQVEATIDAEIAGLAERYNQSGLSGLNALISDRLSRQKTQATLYLLTDADFRPLVGNLKKWPEGRANDDGWITFRTDRRPGDDDDRHPALARIFHLRGGFHLLVGRDVHDLEEIRALIADTLVWGMLITFVLALAGGTMMSRTMMHRIEMINATCRRIMGGDLSRRIPGKGSGDDFDKLVDNLNQMLDQIEELMQGVRQVTNNIAHDLRTPLTRLRRRLDMLREAGAGEESQRELLDQAIGEADGLLSTFKAMLRISEVESGSRRAGFKAVEMGELLNDLVEFYEPLCEAQGQQFTASLTASCPLHGDRDLLFQAFANVLDNAIKYTPPGGRIVLATEHRADGLQVSVSDSGPGIPPAMREKVFERFFRLEASRSTPGNGLGLALVAAIVTLHHGRIELADNHPGLTVVIRLPLSA